MKAEFCYALIPAHAGGITKGGFAPKPSTPSSGLIASVSLPIPVANLRLSGGAPP